MKTHFGFSTLPRVLCGRVKDGNIYHSSALGMISCKNCQNLVGTGRLEDMYHKYVSGANTTEIHISRRGFVPVPRYTMCGQLMVNVSTFHNTPDASDRSKYHVCFTCLKKARARNER